MLSTNYRLKLEFICKCIANGEQVKLEDMIWAEKLGKANTSAREMLRKARQVANNPDMILEDIRDILSSRAEQAYQEFTRLNDLEHKLCYQQTTD
jgi:hypothetical protein